MKRTILDVIFAIDAIVILATICMLDSESFIPAFVCACALIIMIGLTYVKERGSGWN